MVARLSAVLILVAAGTGQAAVESLPTSDAELVATVRSAIIESDMATFDQLINWDGASKMARRVVTFSVRHGLGRPIRSIALEPFPADGLAKIEAQGKKHANMPVTNQLRVVFDEPPIEGLTTSPTTSRRWSTPTRRARPRSASSCRVVACSCGPRREAASRSGERSTSWNVIPLVTCTCMSLPAIASDRA